MKVKVDPTITGKEAIPFEVEFEAIKPTTDDLFTITLVDGRTTKWSA